MTGPRLDVTSVSSASPESAIAADLMLPLRTRRHDLVFEIVRAVAFASTPGGQPVAEHTLVDRATAACEPVVHDRPVRVRAQVISAIMNLEALGDFAQLVNGGWVCAPPLIVDTSGAGDSLLISGMPLRALPPEFLGRTRVDGPLRRVLDGGLMGTPAVDLTTWERGPDLPLDEWTDNVLSSELDSPDIETVRTAHYRFYLPGNADPSASQEGRWFSTSSGMRGRNLARVRRITGTLDHQIVELDGGRVKAARSISSDTARRLMYGLDVDSGNTTRASLRQPAKNGRSDGVTVRVSDALPHAEFRQMTRAARQSSDREWVLPREYGNGVPALAGLGIKLVTV